MNTPHRRVLDNERDMLTGEDAAAFLREMYPAQIQRFLAHHQAVERGSEALEQLPHAVGSTTGKPLYRVEDLALWADAS